MPGMIPARNFPVGWNSPSSARTGKQTAVLTARRGSILPAENRMQVDQQVVFTNARGEKLETEQLTWDRDSGRVHTDKP
jgi:hypothetical protein